MSQNNDDIDYPFEFETEEEKPSARPAQQPGQRPVSVTYSGPTTTIAPPPPIPQPQPQPQPAAQQVYTPPAPQPPPLTPEQSVYQAEAYTVPPAPQPVAATAALPPIAKVERPGSRERLEILVGILTFIIIVALIIFAIWWFTAP